MRTFCPTRAAAVAPGWRLHCHATSMLRPSASTWHSSDRQTDGREARRRRPAHAPRCPPVLRAHCREPWLLNAPAAPCCRALTPAHCPRCPLPTAPVPPARATAAKKKLLAATSAAAETWCMGTAQKARDMQMGAGAKARTQATVDVQPTVDSERHSACRPRCRPSRSRRPRSRR